MLDEVLKDKERNFDMFDQSWKQHAKAGLVLSVFACVFGAAPLLAAEPSSAAPADDYAQQKMKPTDGIPVAPEGYR